MSLEEIHEYAKHQIDIWEARLKLDLIINQPWLSNTGVDQHLETTLQYSIQNKHRGMGVLYIPPGSGTTSRARQVLLKNHGSIRAGFVFTLPAAFFSASLMDALLFLWSNQCQTDVPLLDWFPSCEYGSPKNRKPIIIILDHVDGLMTHPEFETFFQNLSRATRQSHHSRRFEVICLCSTTNCAKRLRGMYPKLELRTTSVDLIQMELCKAHVDHLFQFHCKISYETIDKYLILDIREILYELANIQACIEIAKLINKTKDELKWDKANEMIQRFYDAAMKERSQAVDLLCQRYLAKDLIEVENNTTLFNHTIKWCWVL